MITGSEVVKTVCQPIFECIKLDKEKHFDGTNTISHKEILEIEKSHLEILKDPWSHQEELELLIQYKRFKNKWCNISRSLNNRSNNSVKNKFYSIFRRIKNKIKRMDLSCSSELERIEVFYIIDLIEDYFSQPHSSNIKRLKRGTDFIFTLLGNMKSDEVSKYKEELLKLHIKESSLELLLDKIVKDKPTEKTSGYNNLYSLPLPRNLFKSVSITDDEKTFIRSQLFIRKKEDSIMSINLSEEMQA